MARLTPPAARFAVPKYKRGTSRPPSNDWYSVAGTADGSKVVATISYDQTTGTAGSVYGTLARSAGEFSRSNSQFDVAVHSRQTTQVPLNARLAASDRL